MLGAQNSNEFVGQPRSWVWSSLFRTTSLQGKPSNRCRRPEVPTPLRQQTMHRLDGTSFEAEFRVIPISYAGQPAIQFVMRDITERKRAEEQIHQLLTEVARQKDDLEIRVARRTAELHTLNYRLQDELAERQRLVQSLSESKQRFQVVFDTSPDAIFLHDPHDPSGEWRIVDCNPAACEMNGYTREELIGQSIDILNVPPVGPEEFAASLEHLQREGALHAVEAVHRHKDGHVFPIEYSTSLITVEGRELVLGIDRDITERKQVEEDLNQLNLRLQDELAERQRLVQSLAGERTTLPPCIRHFTRRDFPA